MAGTPNILITRPHNLGAGGIKTAIVGVSQDMYAKWKITGVWKGNDLNFEAREGLANGLRGTIGTGPTQVQIAVYLPLMLVSFKKAIEEGIVEFLNKHLKSG